MTYACIWAFDAQKSSLLPKLVIWPIPNFVICMAYYRVFDPCLMGPINVPEAGWKRKVCRLSTTKNEAMQTIISKQLQKYYGDYLAVWMDINLIKFRHLLTTITLYIQAQEGDPFQNLNLYQFVITMKKEPNILWFN